MKEGEMVQAYIIYGKKQWCDGSQFVQNIFNIPNVMHLYWWEMFFTGISSGSSWILCRPIACRDDMIWTVTELRKLITGMERGLQPWDYDAAGRKFIYSSCIVEVKQIFQSNSMSAAFSYPS